MTRREQQRWALAALLGSAWGCITDLDVGTLPSPAPRPDAATAAPDATADAATAAPDAASAGPDAGSCRPVACRGQPAACGNCRDDDGDGLIDAQDPDCFSPCHDNEAAFGKRMPCPEGSCYFDADCGLGNDARCLSSTPNGCDCHGCCYSELASRYVLLRGNPDEARACSSATLLAAEACPSCTPDPDCFNPCDACELCFGEVALPAACVEELDCESPPHCPAPSTSCLPGVCAEPCASDTLCVAGCCVPAD